MTSLTMKAMQGLGKVGKAALTTTAKVVSGAASEVQKTRENLKLVSENESQDLYCSTVGFVNVSDTPDVGCCQCRARVSNPGVNISPRIKELLSEEASTRIYNDILAIYQRVDKKLVEDTDAWFGVMYFVLILILGGIIGGLILIAVPAIQVYVSLIMIGVGILSFFYMMIPAKQLRTLQLKWGYANLEELNNTVKELNSLFDPKQFEMTLIHANKKGKDLEQDIEDFKTQRYGCCPEVTRNWCGWMFLCFCGCEECLCAAVYNCRIDFQVLLVFNITVPEGQKVTFLPTI